MKCDRGFSTYTWRPVWQAQIVGSACQYCMVATETDVEILAIHEVPHVDHRLGRLSRIWLRCSRRPLGGVGGRDRKRPRSRTPRWLPKESM